MAGGRNRATIYGYFSEVYYAFGDLQISPSGETTQKFLWQTMPDTGLSFLKSTLNKNQEVFGTFIEPNFTKLFELAKEKGV